MERLGKELARQMESSPKAPLIQALQSLRGIGRLTAITLVAEIGTFSRFRVSVKYFTPTRARKFMGN
jgi:transposase